ncbi:MAG: peptide ABC transporter substrate-binding protein [Chloroflexi bacterium]|nr:MAG: peptide ABC transporter substrate-binding protein [Chloroflexota bacterium]
MRPSKKLKAGFLPTLLALVAMLVVACGGGGTTTGTTPTSATHTKAAQSQQVLISAAEVGTSDILSFDPALAPDAFSSAAIDMVFTGMLQLNNKLEVECVLCSTYSVGSDGVTWTFNLKPNLKFSDGTPLTAQDVVYSMDRALDPKTQSGTAPYYMRYIKDATARNGGTVKSLIGDSLVAVDNNTVKVVAASPVAFFLESLVYPTSWVVEKSVVTKWGKAWTDHLADNGGQGGAGPFKVLEYTHNKQIVFVPNPNYFGTPPQLAKVVYPFYKSFDTGYQVYQVNGLDSTGIPTSHLDTDRHRADFINAPFLAINYYTMNYLQKPFDVTSCRQAFALAINKDVIVKSVWKNSFKATNHIVPEGQYGYNPNLKGPDGTTSTAGNQTAAQNDLKACEQAQGYASAANFPPVTLTYSSAGAQDVRNEVAAMQQMWQNVLGISVKTDDIDINKLFSDEGLGSNNPLQFYTGPAWLADYPDPQDWTTLQFDKGASQNGMSFGQNHGPDAAAQQMVQQQMEAADKITDKTQREMAYWNIEQQLVNYVAWFPMEQQEINILQKPCVQGVVQNAMAVLPPEDWANIYISTDQPCAKLS